MKERLDIPIPDATGEELKELAERRQITITETLRRAVGVYLKLEVGASEGKGLQFSHTSWVTEEDGSITTTSDRQYFRLQEDGQDLLYSRTHDSSSIDTDNT